ncbi:photosynthetic NDH subunit of subcomplex B 5, chloroplastic [Selaginella moellendorffii]|nr:photosynthetic NDH subunit of subcomplex B 5, chloroplastic [Selaginella moellendorffii]|eukprot:XP_002993070.2 photosynthetic NDH subunit of subcomplex B 5, chloroplastic [Selaginella moellendorffii]
MAMAVALIPLPPRASLSVHQECGGAKGLGFGIRVASSSSRPRLLLRPPNGQLGFYVEPDIDEDEVWDPAKTKGDDELDSFPWGIADGAHSWHGNEDDRPYWEIVAETIEKAGGPTSGLQKWISWSFLPILFTGMAFGAPATYLFLYTVLFIFAFIGIEMDKPDQPHNFDPETYLEMMAERDKAKMLELGPGNDM